jgi:hypothetical protein
VPPANIYDQEVKKVIRKAVRAEQGRQETPGIFLGAVLPGRHGQADHEDELHFSLLLEAAVAEAAETRIMEVAAPTEINWAETNSVAAAGETVIATLKILAAHLEGICSMRRSLRLAYDAATEEGYVTAHTDRARDGGN